MDDDRRPPAGRRRPAKHPPAKPRARARPAAKQKHPAAKQARTPGKAPQSPRGAKKLALFEAAADGRFFLRAALLDSYRWWARAPESPGAEYLTDLRRRLDERRLRDFGFEGSPAALADETLLAAVTSGIVANPAFLDIVDGELVRAACFCCYYTRSRAQAESVERQIRLFLGYFSQESYESSNAFYRLLCGLARDAPAGEVGAMAGHAAEGPQDHQRARSEGAPFEAQAAAEAMSRRAGVCAAAAAHPAGGAGLLAAAGVALWVYSTPEARKHLRRLAQACKPLGLALTTRLVAPPLTLRFKLRVHALECHGESLEAFWPLVGKTEAPRSKPRAQALSKPWDR